MFVNEHDIQIHMDSCLDGTCSDCKKQVSKLIIVITNINYNRQMHFRYVNFASNAVENIWSSL